jgi:hypothetical protein
MERLWRTLDQARGNLCNPNLIERIIVEYKTKWIHRALRMTPEAARQSIPNWRFPNAVIVPEVEGNPNWPAQSN